MTANKYELALFMMIRNQIFFTGKKLQKSEDEINKMAADTMSEIMKGIDFKRAQRIYAKVSQSDEPNQEEIKEVKSLRWLALNFPRIEKPQNEGDKLCSCINRYCNSAADLIERLAAENEKFKEQLDEYPFKCKVGNNSEIYSKSIEDYDRLIADIGAEANETFVNKFLEKAISTRNYFEIKTLVTTVLNEIVGEKA